MKKQNKKINEKDLIPYPTIKAASEGDVMAINAVLKHYEKYIVSLSTRRYLDEYGYPHYYVDQTLRRRLETKLITKVLKFEPVPHGIKKAVNK